MPPAPAAPRVAVVGPERVGKRALALALGASHELPAYSSSSSGDGKGGNLFTWRETNATLRILHDRRQLAAFDRLQDRECDADRRAQVVVIVVVFDLTRKESFEAALAQVRLACSGSFNKLGRTTV